MTYLYPGDTQERTGWVREMNQAQILLLKSLLSRGENRHQSLPCPQVGGMTNQDFASAPGFVSQHLSHKGGIFRLLVHLLHLTMTPGGWRSGLTLPCPLRVQLKACTE